MRIITRGLIAGIIVITLGIAGHRFFERRREVAIESTLSWARMAEVPSRLKVVSVDSRGSLFTREFLMTVSGESDDIEDWLNASPGIQDSTRIQERGMTIYQIKPGGGAVFAEATYAVDKRTLIIRVYWS